MNAKTRPLSAADWLIVKPVARGRLTAIGALRAVAALCVILPHFVGLFSDLAADSQRLGAWMATLGELGLHGADIFFVVSGFVIAFTAGRPLTWRGVPNLMLRWLAPTSERRGGWRDVRAGRRVQLGTAQRVERLSTMLSRRFQPECAL